MVGVQPLPIMNEMCLNVKGVKEYKIDILTSCRGLCRIYLRPEQSVVLASSRNKKMTHNSYGFYIYLSATYYR